jgi:queuine tRNA-ribosyltransferase
MKDFGFNIHSELDGTLARAGEIITPHGTIQTPAFITVGTKATVKAVAPEQVKDLGSQAVLANTYHLYLKPGSDIVRDMGGLHKFMNWGGPIFTDSGGFQVFSLGEAYGKGVSKVASGNDTVQPDKRPSGKQLMKIDDEGVTFHSHIDGSKHRLTPEKSMQIQHDLGADIIFAFDECTSPQADYTYQKQALERTHAWAARSLAEHKALGPSSPEGKPQALFGIVQGGRHEDLRKHSAEVIGGMDFDGFGIGGSFNKDDMPTAVRWVCETLPKNKPRHLLGIGEPIDLFEGIENGIDTFDCVSPTRVARNSAVYTRDGRVNLSNTKYMRMAGSIVEDCECYTCQNYSLAYLSHLVRADEMLSATLLSIHNLHFITQLVADIRVSLIDGSFFSLKQDFLRGYYNAT